MRDHSLVLVNAERQTDLSSNPSSFLMSAIASEELRMQLVRMFRDPYVLDEPDRAELVHQLREAVSMEPQSSGLRVLLGMALCVNIEVQEGLEELRGAVRMAPDSFIARLKLGELLMRLRVCSEAQEHTHIAAQLAENAVQSELARKQAAALRTMLREGIERGGFYKMKSVFARAPRWFARINPKPSAAALTSGD
jgi:hypothetical protein